MQTIEPLTLGQDRVDEAVEAEFGTARQRWYGWGWQGGISWSATPHHRDTTDGPDYACDVTLPAVCLGSPEELRSDIAAALRRHASRLGIS